jgi:hypothetical protein
MLSALLLLATLLVAPARAAAAEPRIPAPSAPAGCVQPGAEMTTVLGPLPASIHEVELYLVTDDGERFLRVSSETEARSGRIHWRMPRIHARSARLVLRAGSEHGEWESAPSAEFTVIDGAKDAASLRAAAIAGRLDESSPLAAKDTLPGGWRARRGDAALQMARVLANCAESQQSRDDAAPLRENTNTLFGGAHAEEVATRQHEVLDGTPERTPLRI